MKRFVKVTLIVLSILVLVRFAMRIVVRSIASFEPVGRNAAVSYIAGWVAVDETGEYYRNSKKEMIGKQTGYGLEFLTESVGSEISLMNGWLYYTPKAEGPIYRMRTDGTKKQRLVGGANDEVTVCGNVVLYRGHGNWFRESGIYMHHIPTRITIMLAEDPLRFQIRGDIIYYTKQEIRDVKASLYSLNIRTGEEVCLKEGYIWGLAVSEKYLVYQQSHRKEEGMEWELYCLDLSTQEEKIISTDNISSFAIYGDTIYYIDRMRHLFRMDINGENIEELVTDKICGLLDIHNDTLYFQGSMEKEAFYKADLIAEIFEPQEIILD